MYLKPCSDLRKALSHVVSLMRAGVAGGCVEIGNFLFFALQPSVTPARVKRNLLQILL